ncbi:thioredoxin family protein [Gracilimonas tropica]|uniref:thioredoxin family protein n=1 Tax=Gracilimonas tropica TaxID=454600 RepID=UPI000360A0FA|nr:thioredoxin fold domain-containing protein [Gracilimonas tropica]
MHLKTTFLFFAFSLFSISILAQDDTPPDPKKMFDWKPLKEAQKLASENDKKVLIYGNARWCTYCKKMEKEVFPSKEVQERTEKHFYPVWLDIESQDSLSFRGKTMTHRQLAMGFRITGTPTFIFLDSEGEVIAGQPGFIPEELYLTILDFVGSDAYLDQDFGEFSGAAEEQ